MSLEIRESEGFEIREFLAADLEIRASKDTRDLKGYAALYNMRSVLLGWYTEEINAGAFRRTLTEMPDVRALADHDTGKVVSRVKAGSLELREDSKGLYFEARVAKTHYGDDLLELVRGGEIDGMSIGFRVKTAHWELKDGKDHRVIEDLDLLEISFVAFPAYPQTSVAQRSAIQKVWEDRKEALRAASKGESLRLVERALDRHERNAHLVGRAVRLS